MNKTRIGLCLAIFFLIICLLSAVRINKNTISVSVPPDNRPTVIIDAGHGGEDGGAISSSGLLEKDINLSIALTLQKLFTQSGFEVVMTRTEDKAIYSENCESLREKKVSDIHNRTNICNQNQNNIFISIHQNKFEQSKYSGTQVFYSSNNILSSELAECIQNVIKGTLQKNNNRQCKPSDDNVYILKHAEVPAILIECGFLSNPQEEASLKTEQYRNQLAFAIFSGFLEFYYQTY